MTRMAAFLLLLVVAACTPATEAPDSVPMPSNADALTGTVRMVGSAPVNIQLVLQPEDGPGVRLAGPLRPELERLTGSVVRVTGPVRPSSDPIVTREVEVTDYDVISIDGRPVIVGEVVSISGGWVRLRTDEGREIYLSGAPETFREGQKVWVQGPDAAIVQSYGTIRP